MTQHPSGVYRPGDSILHGLDGAVKLICFFLLLIAVLTTDTPAGYTAMLLFTVAASYLAHMDKKSVFGSIKQFWWLLLLVILSNFAFYAPDETFGAWWVFTPSYIGLYKGICIALRIGMILVLASILSSTTASLKLLSGLETVLSPLGKLNIPVERFVSAVELTTRLIPALTSDAELIRRHQKMRGNNFAAKGFLNKAGTAMPMVLPLLLSSFRRADELAFVMETRGFAPGKKAFPAKKIEVAAGEWAALLVCGAVCAMQMLIL